MNLKLLAIILIAVISLTGFASARIDVQLIKMGSPVVTKEKIVYIERETSSSFSGSYAKNSILQFCACSQIHDSIKIKNQRLSSSFYTIKSNLDFVQVEQPVFELASGEVKEVGILIDSPCNTGEKTLKLSVESSSGEKGIIEKELVIGRCQNLVAKLKADQEEIDPCKEADYEIYIENTGDFKETYSLKSNQNVDFSDNNIGLDAGGNATVDAALMLSCGVYGIVPVKFYVTAVSNQLQTELSHGLKVEHKYDYSLSIAEEIDLCEDDLYPVEVEVKNKGAAENTYYFELLNAPKFVSMTSGNITVKPEENKLILLDLDIAEGKNIGRYEFLLRSHAEYGNVSEEKTIILNIHDCYNHQIAILNKDLDFCAEDRNVTVNVKNLGERTENIALHSMPEFTHFVSDSVTLAPGEEKDITLKITPRDIYSGADLVVEATLANGLRTEDRARMEILSLWTCHNIKLNREKYSIRRDTEKEFVVKVENIGLLPGNYSISLEPTDFWAKPDQKTMFLEPDEKKELLLLSNHTQENRFGDYLVHLTFRDGKLEYKKDIILTLKDKPLYEKAYLYFLDKPCQFVSVLLIIAAIVLFIVSLATKKKGRLRKKKFLLFSLLLLVIFLFAVWMLYHFKGLPYLNEPVDGSKVSATHFIWAQDKVYSLPVESFVSDPDADVVTLKPLEDNEFVDFSVENDQMLFKPNPGWYGNTSVVFVASDSKGGVSISPKIALEVLKRDKYSLFGAYEKLCAYANLFLLLIILLLVMRIGHKKIRIYPFSGSRR